MGKSVLAAALLVLGSTLACFAGAQAEPPVKLPEVSTGPITFSVFVDHTWFFKNNWEGDVPAEITRKTGVSLEPRIASDDNQLPVLIASGDLPDMVYAARLFDKLGTESVCWPYNVLIKQYAPTFVVGDDERGVNTMPDGNFYSIKNAAYGPKDFDNPFIGSPSGTPHLGVRSDILRQIGNPPIDTWADFEKVCDTVRSRYPEMLVLMIGNTMAHWDLFFNEFGSGASYMSREIYQENGSVKHRISDPAYMETLTFLNRLRRKGMIEPETLIYDSAKFGARMNKGDVFAAVNSGGPALLNASLERLGVAARYTNIKKVLGPTARKINADTGWSGLYITKKNKDPGRAIRFMEWMRTTEAQRLTCWGIEGKHYTMHPDGYPVRVPAIAQLRSTNADAYYRETGIGVWIFGEQGALERLLTYDPANTEVNGPTFAWKKILVFDKPLSACVPEGDIDEAVIYTKVVQLEKEYKVKMIAAETGQQFNALRDELMKKAQATGLPQLEKWMSARYAEVKKRFQ